MVQMLGVFAEFERATLIDRVIAGMERKAARGGWHGGMVPFGYRLAADHALEKKMEEAPLVRQIFELYANQRLGARAVASWLNERGHRTAAGKPWSFRSILNLIQNRMYLGEINFHGVHHEAAHPALVEKPLFEVANKVLNERGEDFAKRRSSPAEYMLTGLVVCARCGKKYVGAAGHGRRSRYRYYVCQSRHRTGVHGCQGDNLPADKLESELSEALMAVLARYDLIEDALQEAQAQRQSARPRHAEQIAATNAEIRKTEDCLLYTSPSPRD